MQHTSVHDQAGLSFVFAQPIVTSRLSIIPASASHVQAELNGNSVFGAYIHAAVPESWPPGQYDRDAQQYFLDSLHEAGDAGVGWFGWYAVRNADRDTPATLVGCGGYFGPPSPDGVVEVGYSVCAEWQGHGYASELTQALVDHVLQHPAVSRIIAHTHADNAQSIAVLRKCGFAEAATSDHADALLFEWTPITGTG